MLLNLHKKNWTEGLRLKDWQQMKTSNEDSIKVSFFCQVHLALDAPGPTDKAGLCASLSPCSACSSSRRPTRHLSRRKRL